MRLLSVLLVVSLTLAGCAAPGATEPGPEAVGNASVVFTEDYAFANTTVPKEELQNATLGEEHVHDAWGGFEELVLLDETREAGLCEGPVDAAFYAVVNGGFGCVGAFLPEGVVVPEGTGQLRIEVDATDALKAGEMRFQFRNKAREEELDASADPKTVWLLPLAQPDWDIPHAPATSFVMYVGAAGPGSVFEGAVHLRIVAERMPGWAPILAVAHVDHWKLPQLHDFAAPGVMTLLVDGEGHVTNIDPDRFLGGSEHGGVAFTDIVAPGAKHLTVVADTVSSDCVPAIRCWFVPELHVGGFERDRLGTLLHEEGGRRIYVWSVPDEVPEDSVYADVSTTGIEGRIDACATGDAGGPTCGYASMVSGSATARLFVHAWQGDVDVELLSGLVGPAPE